ncbi:MAG TPA: hypothetical protein VGM92_02360 [Candidatus Kapabacteria bacterium]|jgi:hypothetical protein
MKQTILLALFCIVFSASSLQAQGSSADAPATNASATNASATNDIRLGAVFMPGLSANAGTVANGTKTDATDFSWALGALADFPLNQNIGIQVGLCYDNRTVGFHDQATSDTSNKYTFSYFSFRPELRIGDFVVGLGLGVPIGASSTASADSKGQNAPTTLAASNMNFLLEGRIGAAVPIVDMQNGNEIKFHVEAAYAFSQIVSSPLTPNDGSQNKTENSGPIASVQLGISYLFDLTPR